MTQELRSRAHLPPLTADPIRRPPAGRASGRPGTADPRVSRRHGGVARFRAAAVPRLVLADAQIVLDMAHARDRLRDVLGAALLLAVADRARERDLPVLNGDLDLGGVDHGIVGQMLVDILPNPVVRAPIVLRPAPLMLAAAHLAATRRGVVAEAGVPGPDAVVPTVVSPHQVALPLAVVVAPVESVVAAGVEAPWTAGDVRPDALARAVVAAARAAAMGGTPVILAVVAVSFAAEPAPHLGIAHPLLARPPGAAEGCANIVLVTEAETATPGGALIESPAAVTRDVRGAQVPAGIAAVAVVAIRPPIEFAPLVVAQALGPVTQ